MININYARRFKTIRPELNRVTRLGHDIRFIDTQEQRSRIVAKGRCECCGGTLVIERDRKSTEADALRVTGDVLAMECV